MGVIHDLQIEPLVPNILLCRGEVLHIHNEGDFSPFRRRESCEMSGLGGVKRRQFLGSLDRHNVLDPVHMSDDPFGSGQETAALVGSEFSGMGDHVVENLLGNNEFRHGQIVQVTA
jgi:hypothetical protein